MPASKAKTKAKPKSAAKAPSKAIKKLKTPVDPGDLNNGTCASSQTKAHPWGKGNTDWFVKDRFGMFIHYGLFSSHGLGEWAQVWENIKISDYEKFAEDFCLYIHR